MDYRVTQKVQIFCDLIGSNKFSAFRLIAIVLITHYLDDQVLVERPFAKKGGVFFSLKNLLKQPIVPYGTHSKLSETECIYLCNLVHHRENLRFFEIYQINCQIIEKSVIFSPCA